MAPDQDLEMMMFSHVFQSCNQDSPAVQAIMTNVIGKLKKVMPTLCTVYYRQDNARCYRSGGTIIGAIQAGKSHGVKAVKETAIARQQQLRPTFESI